MHRLALVVVGFILLMFAAIALIAPEKLKPSTSQQTSYGEALIGGSFEAMDHTGEPITDKDLLGKYALIYFGFTYCPDICPTTLLIVANVLDGLNEARASQLTPVFVSVDPARDTVEVMANYVSNFHPKLIGITGTKEQIDRIAKAYKVYYQVVENEDSALGYQVDHSGFLYLMGPDGKYITHFPHNVSEQDLATALRSHIAND